MSGNGVHTFRFLNAQGQSTLFKYFWLPTLGYRSLVYDEVTKIAGKNNNFQRVDLYNNIEAGIYPEWELAVQLFPDDGTYMYKGYDLIIPTQIVPFEINAPIKLGKMTLNRNPNNFFAEPESISFAPSNVVNGVSFVPDPLLQWRLMVRTFILLRLPLCDAHSVIVIRRHVDASSRLAKRIHAAYQPRHRTHQQQLPRQLHATLHLRR